MSIKDNSVGYRPWTGQEGSLNYAATQITCMSGADTCDQRQALDAVKVVGVPNAHDAIKLFCD